MRMTPPTADVVIPRPDVFISLRDDALAHPLTNLSPLDPRAHSVVLRGGWRIMITANN